MWDILLLLLLLLLLRILHCCRGNRGCCLVCVRRLVCFSCLCARGHGDGKLGGRSGVDRAGFVDLAQEVLLQGTRAGTGMAGMPACFAAVT